jgi:hypothetical protein
MQRSTQRALWKCPLCGVLCNLTFGGSPIKRGDDCFAGSYHFCMSVNICDWIEIKPLEYLWHVVTTLEIAKGKAQKLPQQGKWGGSLPNLHIFLFCSTTDQCLLLFIISIVWGNVKYSLCTVFMQKKYM